MLILIPFFLILQSNLGVIDVDINNTQQNSNPHICLLAARLQDQNPKRYFDKMIIFYAFEIL